MVKSYSVILTPQAIAQIECIADYIESVLLAKDAADKFLLIAKEKILSLSFFPRKYPVVYSSKWHHKEIRKFSFNGYVAYYYVNEKSSEIVVVAFGCQKMNQQNFI